MAIFQKAYRGYEGQFSPLYLRPLVIFRYVLADMFSSRLFIAFFIACFAPVVFGTITVYMRYNLDAIMQLEVNVNSLVYVDAEFFADWILIPQLQLILVLIMFNGPTMVAPDLRNNAMPLYLSRPISKLSYISGKFLAILVLGSLVSWIPFNLLLFYQSYLAGNNWLAANANLPFAAIGISFIWITTLTLLSFAISATVKWAPIARLAFFGIVFVSAVLGNVINAIVGGYVGSFFNIYDALESLIWNGFGLSDVKMPVSAALSMLSALAVVSFLVLMRRIRANEVVA